MNRDVRNIVVLDYSEDWVKYHPDNVIVLEEFDGDKNDWELDKALPLLQYLSDPKVDIQSTIKELGNVMTTDVFLAGIEEDMMERQRENDKAKGFDPIDVTKLTDEDIEELVIFCDYLDDDVIDVFYCLDHPEEAKWEYEQGTLERFYEFTGNQDFTNWEEELLEAMNALPED